MEIKNVLLKEYSSLQIGGVGKLIIAKNLEELKEGIMYAKAEGLRVHVLGEGTNSYFGEDLSDYLFIKPELIGKTTDHRQQTTDNADDYVLLTAGSGEIWDDIVKLSVDKGLWGIENLSHIPGTVGAAPVQNIGAYGVELAEVFVSLQAFDTETQKTVEFDREACRFGYRDSIFKYYTSPDGSPSSSLRLKASRGTAHKATTGHSEKRHIILSVTLKLYKKPHPVLVYKPLDTLKGGDDITPQMVRNMVIETRNIKLPDYKEYPNAGSFFKNPIVDVELSEYVKNLYPEMPLIEMSEGYKIPSAWLIDHVAEMKGVRMGEVGTWPTQPLVIVNYGDGTADDIDEFAKAIRTKVHEKTGIVLEQEVNRVG